MLVLATVRRAADESAISRATVEGMFREADVNNDGEITFQEWFQWLGSTPSSGLNKTSGAFTPHRSTGSSPESSGLDPQKIIRSVPDAQEEKVRKNQDSDGFLSESESESESELESDSILKSQKVSGTISASSGVDNIIKV